MGPSGSRDLERLRLQHCCTAQRPGPWLAGLARVKALQAAGPEGGRPGRVGACVGPAGWSGPRRAVVVPPGSLRLCQAGLPLLAQGGVGGGRMRGLDGEAAWSRGPHPALGVLSQRRSLGWGLLPVSSKGLEVLWAPGPGSDVRGVLEVWVQLGAVGVGAAGRRPWASLARAVSPLLSRLSGATAVRHSSP